MPKPVKWEKRYSDVFLRAEHDGENYDKWLKEHWNDNQVKCPCGSESFHLRYGDYEVRAVCVSCGLEDVVYDG